MVSEPKQERSDAARNRRAILEATASLLAEFGADNVTIEQIAEAAGVGKGTVFHRFGSRAGLMRELAFERGQALMEAVTSGPPPLGPGAPAADRLVAYFDEIIRLVIDNIELNVAYNDAATPHTEEINLFWHNHVRTLLAEARPDVDAEMLAHLLLNTMRPDLVLFLIQMKQTDRFAASVHSLVASIVVLPV